MKKRVVWFAAVVVGAVWIYLFTGNLSVSGLPVAEEKAGVWKVPFIRGATLAVVPASNGRGIWVGTERALYQSPDGGHSWRRLFRGGVFGRAVRVVAVHPSEERFLWIATADELFASSNGGRRFRKVLSATGRILCLAVDSQVPARILVGSEKGVYFSEDGAFTWRGLSLGLPAGPVRSAVCQLPQGLFYVQTDAGLFELDFERKVWRRLRVFFRREPEGLSGEDTEENKVVEQINPSSLVAEPLSGKLYVGTPEGLFVRTKDGQLWERIPTNGLATPEIRQIVLDPGPLARVYVLTSQGLFVWVPERSVWVHLQDVLSPQEILSVSLEPAGGFLWVGTSGGLFKVSVPRGDSVAENAVVPDEFNGPDKAPAIQQVQQAAICYAEVGPEKIRGWRTRALLSGWLPKVSFSVDKDRNRTIASASSAGKTSFFVGPEDESLGVGVDFAWELGDLIWNPDQVSIDTRSRLMVQLRQDILEEVTRLYYERKRLMAEFSGHPTGDSVLSAERRLRIEEVEAQLDALTNGYFSKNVN